LCLCWLLTEVGSVVRALDGNEGLNSEEAGEGVAFLIGELVPETVGAEDGLALRLRHLAEVTEGTGDQAAAIFGEAAKLLHGSANLLTLGRREMRDGLVVLNDAAALFGRHTVELRETIEHVLLRQRRKVAEARLLLQGPLLVSERLVAVTIHPLAEMILVLLLGAGTGVR
jgi:hypothetical protein